MVGKHCLAVISDSPRQQWSVTGDLLASLSIGLLPNHGTYNDWRLNDWKYDFCAAIIFTDYLVTRGLSNCQKHNTRHHSTGPVQMALMYDHLMGFLIGESVMLIVVVGGSGATEHENGIHYVCVSERHVLLFKCWPFSTTYLTAIV